MWNPKNGKNLIALQKTMCVFGVSSNNLSLARNISAAHRVGAYRKAPISIPLYLTRKRIFRQEDRMERIYRKGFGFCLISHKSFQTHRIINRSSSVFSVRFDSFVPAHSPFGPASGCSFSHLPLCSIVVSSAGFRFNEIFVLSFSPQRFATRLRFSFLANPRTSGLEDGIFQNSRSIRCANALVTRRPIKRFTSSL